MVIYKILIMLIRIQCVNMLSTNANLKLHIFKLNEIFPYTINFISFMIYTSLHGKQL